MANPLKVGVIGVGGIGNLHLRTFKRISDIVVAAFVESSEEIGRRVQASSGVRWYKDTAEMLEKERLDAVSICTPPFAQLDLARTCIKNGTSVLIEKPVGTSRQQAADLYNLSLEHEDLAVMPGCSLFFDQGFQDLFSLLKNGELGRPIFGYFNMVGRLPYSHWAHDRTKAGGGVLVDKGSHFFPLILRLFGSPLDLQSTFTLVDDTGQDVRAEIILKYDNFNLYLMFNWLETRNSTRIEIHGTGGGFFLDNYCGTDFWPETLYGFSVREPHLIVQLMKSLGRKAIGALIGSKSKLYLNEMQIFLQKVREKKFHVTPDQSAYRGWEIPTLADSVQAWELIETAYQKGSTQ